MDDTNTPGPSKSSDLNSLLPRGLLGRKGVPIGQSTRLPSLGRPRDLTLGGTTRRQYAPNIPVRKERGDAQVSSERGRGRGVTTRGSRGDLGRGGGRGRARTRGGRGGGQVQSVGSIFSEGIAQKDLRKTSFGESSRDAKDYVPRPSVNFKTDVKVNKEHEKQTLREILQDNFIDDEDDYDEDSKDHPITLPLCPHITAKKTKPSLKKELKIKAIDKKEKMDISIGGAGDKTSKVVDALCGSVTIKSEPLDMEDDQEADVSDMIKSKWNSMIKEEKDASEECKSASDDEDLNDLRCSKLLLSIQEMEQEELLLFQFPDCLPLLHHSSEDEKPKIKQEPGVGFGVVPDPQKASGSAPAIGTGITDEVKGSSLSDISEGYIGKLQVLKSGKTRLVIGNVTMNVELGTDVGYLQDIVSLRTSGSTGDLTMLGHPRNRLICVPDMMNIHD